ncbi:hypothetical protein [Paraburkholderia dinghuensis]|uniref:Core-binding (CB) domain-containing protein n=1 Tax=Paraburkholderia dinghuensis TaxID=2305225 RepID=A0A3N6MR12_9BURK|nr:hypothetical protein [Paraburkholderia dinghuensis]RQH00141.1 hypothetical protein D1Y85_25615 [Paraburkholderia dinghuensis]
MVADSMLSLYRRTDGKSPYWWLKFVVPESLQAQLGTLKRVSTGQTDKTLARQAALLKVAEWCAPLLASGPPTGAQPERQSEDEPLEPALRTVVLSHELIEELCRARREATMWSAEDDLNGVSFDGLEHEIKGETGNASSADGFASEKHEDAARGDLPPGVVKNATFSDHFIEWAPRLRSVIERGRNSTEFDDVADEAVEFAAVLGYHVRTDDPALVAFVRSLAIADLRAYKAVKAVREGESSEADGFAAVAPAAGSHRLSYLLLQWRANRSRHLRPETAELYASRFRVFIEYLHDIPSRIVTRTHVTRFLEEKVYSGELTEKTANGGYLPALRSVFGYARSVELIDQNPTEGISKPKLSKAERDQQQNRRLPFSTAQLNVLFASAWYAAAAHDVGHSAAAVGHARYWVPLLQLFQNLRPEEACQLEVTDVAVIDGVQALRVEEVLEPVDRDDGHRPLKRLKSVKSAASQRWLPVHQTLLDLDWVEFVSARQAQSEKGWLFPELPRGKNNSDAFGKRFNDFLHKRLQLADVVQYGLRHTWEDERRRAQAHAASTGGAWPPGMYFAIAGRATTEDEEGSAAHYGQGYDLEDMKFFLDQLQFKGVIWPARWSEWVKLYGPLGRDARVRRTAATG